MLEGNSLFVLSPNNLVRALASKLVFWSKFDFIILFFILLSSIKLAIENPLNDPHSELKHVLNIIEYLLVVIFGLEVALKVIVYGFLFNGESSYLRSFWNILDFFVVVTSLISISGDDNLNVFRILRLFRVLRPLRVIARNEGLRIAVQTLIKGIPNLVNLVIV